jgi:CheY-like chemotaxis protein
MLLYKALLLIDDDVEDQEIFIDAIREVDGSIDCTCISSSEEVLQVLREGALQKPDIMFMDLNMPRMNGKQLLAELKKIDHLSTIPVIMYSTHLEARDIAEIGQLGAAHHLVKPSKFSDLCSSLSTILRKQW